MQNRIQSLAMGEGIKCGMTDRSNSSVCWILRRDPQRIVSCDRSFRSYRWCWCIRRCDAHKSKFCEVYVNISENLIAYYGWARPFYLRIRNFDAWCHEVTLFITIMSTMSFIIHFGMCSHELISLSFCVLLISDVRTDYRCPAKLQSDDQRQSRTRSNLCYLFLQFLSS